MRHNIVFQGYSADGNSELEAGFTHLRRKRASLVTCPRSGVQKQRKLLKGAIGIVIRAERYPSTQVVYEEFREYIHAEARDRGGTAPMNKRQALLNRRYHRA